MVKRKSWLLALAVLLVVTGLGCWATRYMAMRAVLSRELSLFSRVHMALMNYQRDTGQFPTALETPDLQRYFTDFNEQDWTFLREQGLTYTAGPMNAASNSVILRAATPWGTVTGHANGNKTYGWEH